MLILLLSTALAILLPTTTNDQFRTITLSNSLQATLISCHNCHEAGVAMGVNVGSLQDSIPGLAHFLEHMLFFSSKTYPQEDYWMTFIETHGGSTNAFTSYDQTVYYFSISNNALQTGLHILSRAFIEPIFSKEAAKREILSVKSEVEGNYDDGWRIQKLVELLIGPPLDHVTIGNADDLAIENITDYMYEFWQKFYRGKNLKLSLTGNYSLDVLEEWVLKYFAEVEPGELNQGVRVLTSDRVLGAKNYVVGDKLKTGKINLVFWVLESETLEFQELDFISYLLQFSLTESLGDVFEAEFYVGKYVDLKDFSVFMIESEQDDPNLYSKKEIFGAILGSIEFLKGISNETLFELWEDYQKLALYDFLYSDPLESADLASTIASNMLYYPEELYYAGTSVKFKYSYEGIQKFLALMKPKNALYSTLTSNSTQKLTNYDPYFDMNYELYTSVFQPTTNSYVHIDQNPFIPNNLKLILNKFTEEILLIEDSQFRVWFKYNTSLRKPVVYIAALIAPEDWTNLRPLAYIHVLALLETVHQELEYYSYAGYSLEAEIVYNGIELTVSGWNERILEYFQTILELFSQIRVTQHHIYQSSFTSKYQSTTFEPYELAIQHLNRLITKSELTNDELIDSIQKLTMSDYLYYEKKIKYSAVHVFILGNLNVPQNTSLVLSKFFVGGSKIEYKRSLLISDYNVFVAPSTNQNAILNWYEFGEFDIHTYVAMQILEMFFSPQAYISLRSKAQLGYTVGLGISDNFMSNALYIIVQGAKYNPHEMQNVIDKFWETAKITEHEVNETKSVMKELMVPPSTYDEIFEFNWEEICSGRFSFDIQRKFLEALEKVQYSQVSSILSKISKHYSELSIRMYASLKDSHEASISPNFFRSK